MQHIYRYLQQTTIPPVKDWKADKGILGNLKCEFMGSAEFEFGALPKALGSLLSTEDSLAFGKVQVELPKDPLKPTLGTCSTLVRYLVRQSQEAGLVNLLQNWKTAMHDFKEWNVHLTKPNDLVFCIDEGYEAFMWQGKLGKRLITCQLQTSIDLLVKQGWIKPLTDETKQKLEEIA